MIKTQYPIHRGIYGPDTVNGFKAREESLLAIHREKRDPWTVTFLPSGTTVNSLFPKRDIPRDYMLQIIDQIEQAELAAWLSLSDIPFGGDARPGIDEAAIARIRTAAGVPGKTTQP